MTAITRIYPGRGYGGETVIASGSGFSLLGNTVEFDGVALPAGDVTIVSSGVLLVKAPTGLPVSKFSVVKVTNLDTSASATWWWWVKDTSANVRADSYLPGKLPGYLEQSSAVTDKYVIRAVNFEEIASYIGAVDDALSAKGTMLAGDGVSGLEAVAAGTNGHRYTAGEGGTGVAWYSNRRAITLSWGLTLSASDILETKMIFNGTSDATTGGTRSYPMHWYGVISNVSVYVDTVVTGSDTVNSMSIYRNGSVAWDSGANTLVGDYSLNLGAQGVWSAGVGLKLDTSVDYFEIGVKKSGPTSTIGVIVTMQVVIL